VLIAILPPALSAKINYIQILYVVNNGKVQEKDLGGRHRARKKKVMGDRLWVIG
jgi:hypothetical protein